MKHTAAIICYGNMGSWHAEQINKLIDDLEVVGIYDIAPERCELAKENGLKVFESAEELYQSDVELVIVATPNNFHKKYSIEAMEAGKHVVCEKPACMNCEELEEIYRVSEKTGKLYTVHQNRRFDVDYAIMREIINRDMLGKLYFLDSRLYSNRGSSGRWRSTYEAGGGTLYDWGIHMIDQVLCLIDSEPEYVYAQLQSVRFPLVDDVCRVNIQFKNGVRAQVIADLWCYIEEPRWHLSGDDGTATIYKWWGKEGKVVKANIKEVDWEQGCVYTPNGLSKTMWPRPKQEISELPLPELDHEPRWEEYYENVVAVMEGKAEPIVTHEQIMRAMRVLMAAFESARNNQTVHLS
ncbi:MAG: Gfo/Idh/MocA family oxidoreductase [Clostridia bacterium]|nr:Gfo/Idh/MocA family oxidoreductase [Clostridia bacterium]